MNHKIEIEAYIRLRRLGGSEFSDDFNSGGCGSDSVTQWLSDSVTQWLSKSVTQWHIAIVTQWLSASVTWWLNDFSDSVTQWLKYGYWCNFTINVCSINPL